MSDTYNLTGALTISNAQQVYIDMQRAINDGTLTFDLAALEGCDSAGVASLIEAVKYAKQTKNQSLSYINQPQQLEELATFLKVDGVLFQ